jgi:predicted nucleotide-binding protein
MRLGRLMNVLEKNIATLSELAIAFNNLPTGANVHNWRWPDVLKYLLYSLPEGKWADREELETMAQVNGSNREQIRKAFQDLADDSLLTTELTMRGTDRGMRDARVVKLEYTARQKVALAMKDAKPLPTQSALPPTQMQTDKVFVVYGHDHEMQETVARLLERQGLEAVLLHEQANEGRVLIQKVEDHSTAGFAIVLLSPDDESRPMKREKGVKEKPRPRARQNVVLELGLCIGKLTRKRVFILYRPGPNFEFPSDMEGMMRSEYHSPKGNWRNDLIKEMKACGYKVTTEKLP